MRQFSGHWFLINICYTWPGFYSIQLLVVCSYIKIPPQPIPCFCSSWVPAHLWICLNIRVFRYYLLGFFKSYHQVSIHFLSSATFFSILPMLISKKLQNDSCPLVDIVYFFEFALFNLSQMIYLYSSRLEHLVFSKFSFFLPLTLANNSIYHLGYAVMESNKANTILALNRNLLYNTMVEISSYHPYLSLNFYGYLRKSFFLAIFFCLFT